MRLVTNQPEPALDSASFDAERHGREARAKYEKVRGNYEQLAAEIASIVQESIRAAGLNVQVTWRAKELDSFERKAAEVDANDPRKPKYARPLTEITDLAGVRVIAYVLEAIPQCDEVVSRELEVVDRIDKTKDLLAAERFGYQSLHLIVKLKSPRTELVENRAIVGLVCEIQVRTVLQHGWAEIEHDIGYRPEGELPAATKRKFQSLAGLLEIADREFQAITNEERQRRAELRAKIDAKKAAEAAITVENLRFLLEKEIGADQRVSAGFWEWIARLARTLGVGTIGDAEAVIRNFDWKAAAAAQWHARPSPPGVFDAMLLQFMGEKYLEQHPWRKERWFNESVKSALAKLRAFGVEPGRKA